MKYVILGAGPSGLGAALSLVDQGIKDVVILEKQDRVGGLSGSFKLDNISWDYGPHRFSPEYPHLVKRFQKILGEDFLEVKNDHAVVFDGRVFRYPPVVTDFLNLNTISHGIEVMCSYLWGKATARFRKKRPETFESNIVENFGNQFYQKVVRPLCVKIWGDPATLDPEFAKLRFSVPTWRSWGKKLLNRKETFNDKTFFYPKYGFQQIWDALAADLKSKGVEIVLNATVEKVALEGEKASSVTYASKHRKTQVDTKWLISTIPTQRFVELLDKDHFSSSVSLQEFRNRGIIFVALKIRKERTLPARVVILPESVYRFSRLYEQNQFSQATVESGCSGVMADIITDIGSKTWNTTDAHLKEEVINQLRCLKFIEESDVVSVNVIRKPVAYPLPTASRERAQTRLNAELTRYKNILCTGRFATTDYNNSHTAIEKSMRIASVVKGDCSIPDYINQVESIRKAAIRD